MIKLYNTLLHVCVRARPKVLPGRHIYGCAKCTTFFLTQLAHIYTHLAMCHTSASIYEP